MITLRDDIRPRRLLVLFAVCLFLIPLTAIAQVITGTIFGTITDQSGRCPV